MPDRLRFAVLCSGTSLTVAGMRAIERLTELEDVLCVAILEIGKEPPPPGGWAWSPYRAWYSSQPRLSIYDHLPKVPKIECSLAIDAQSLSRIAALHLDFCLLVAPLPLAGDLSGVARFGVWTLFYGQDGNPPAFAELERGGPHIPVSLERLGERPEAPRQILRQGVVNAVPWSYRETLENAVTAGVDFPALVARQLLKSGTLPVIGTHAPLPKPPSTGQVASFRIGLSMAWIRYQVLETIRSEMWNVGVVNLPIETFLDGRYPSQIDWLPSPGPGKFLADPFAVETPGGFQLLTEGFDYDRYQGYITSALYRPGLPLSENRVVIDEGVHMSYPFPLMYKGQRYCIPECQTRREVSIYRMEEGSDRWVQAETLIRNFAAVDSTVIQHDGRWWLFCGCQDDLRDCKLYIWHAADLFGPWEPHALNPVQCDVRCSRPGGTPFLHKGQLYRPAQDSSTSYGCALSINRVVRLTVDEFEEETVAHIQPPAGVYYRDGIHTLSAAGTMTVLDGKRMTPIPSLAMRRILYKLKRLAKLA
jgi:hypothetical protein